MNILYMDHYAGSPNMGMEFRPYYLSREWIKMGHKVSILAGDYSHLRKTNPKVNKDFQSEIVDGIEFVWIKTGTYKGNGVARAASMGRFVWKLCTHAKTLARRWKPDVVISSSTYPIDTWPAQMIARFAQCKYVHEVHDMWPSTLYEVGGMPRKHPFVALMQVAENSAYKKCDKCISLPPYTKKYMVKHGLNPGKFVNIQNGVVEEEWDNPSLIPAEYKEFFAEHKDRFIVGYFGGHALSNALDIILDTAKIIDDKDIIFVLVGNGVEKERLIKRKEEEHIGNLFFLDQVDKTAVPDLISYFDCSIMTGMRSPLYRFGLCFNKLYDSMMGGKPVICAINSPKTLIEEYNCGIHVRSAKPQDIKSAIFAIKDMTPGERKAMGLRGKEAVLDNYTYKKLADKFISAINS